MSVEMRTHHLKSICDFLIRNLNLLQLFVSMMTNLVLLALHEKNIVKVVMICEKKH